jgi:hypothetical protein
MTNIGRMWGPALTLFALGCSGVECRAKSTCQITPDTRVLDPSAGRLCGSVQVMPNVEVTAAHCPAYGERLAFDLSADLQLVATAEGREPAAIGLALPGLVEQPSWGKEYEYLYNYYKCGKEFLAVYPPVVRGMSGSGLFQDDYLVGVVIAFNNDVGIATSASEVENLIKEWKKNETH